MGRGALGLIVFASQHRRVGLGNLLASSNFKPIRSSRRAPISIAVSASTSRRRGLAARAWAMSTMARSAWVRKSAATGRIFAEAF